LQLGQEYGDTTLVGRHEMKLARVASLLAELTEYEADRVRLEARAELLENMEESDLLEYSANASIGPEEQLQMRNEYVSSDPKISVMIANVTQLEQQLVAAELVMSPTNPELKRAVDLIDKLNARLISLKEEADKKFEDLMSEKLESADKQRIEYAKVKRKFELRTAKAELEQVRTYEQRFRELLSEEDTETIELGRKQLNIQNLEEQLALTKENHDRIRRRIQDMMMDRKRPARISIADNGDVREIKDKRIKLSAAAVFGSFGFGVAIAFLLAKMDKSLYEPDELVRRVGIRVIGTTTGVSHVDKAMLGQQLMDDYQTIRANLKLFNGDDSSKILAVTSPATKDGKTTLSVNLAISFARSGKKVLLIDGDLRKPDIAAALGLDKSSRGLQDFLFGKDFDSVVSKTRVDGLYVLPSDGRNTADALDLLTHPDIHEMIRDLAKRFDHVIIDTPPVLAFSDALLWAKIADAAILTSFAQRTSSNDLKLAIDRLNQISVNVLGTVMQNVKVENGYHRYGYGYNNGKKRERDGMSLLLDAKPKSKDNSGTDAS
jgi:capsular exopolysaccharide synthesis family protein